MSPEKQRMAIAEGCGWVWYQHPVSRTGDRKYRFLALPACHEFEQSPQWMVRSDGTESPCSMEYMSREFYLPDYTNDLNAMRDAAKSALKSDQWTMYHQLLYRVCGGMSDAIEATAAQRAEALLRTIGKWEE